MEFQDQLAALARPFHPDQISFKPGSVRRDGTAALGLAYVDLRAYMDRLDLVFGPAWAVSYRPWSDTRVICDLTLFSEDGQSCTRSSTGEGEGQNGGPTAEAQAFKRACVMYGMGRYLYDLPQVWAAYDGQARRFTPSGLNVLLTSVVQHYNETTGSHVEMPAGVTSAVPAGEVFTSAAPGIHLPASSVSPAYVFEEESFMDPASGEPAHDGASLVAYVREHNPVPPTNPASAAQLKYLVKTLAWVAGKGSDGEKALDLLTGGAMVDKAVASQLIDWLAADQYDKEAGAYKPNPNYRSDYAQTVKDLYASAR